MAKVMVVVPDLAASGHFGQERASLEATTGAQFLPKNCMNMI